MNTPLPPDPGPFGADTDDAVSALIDGELAGFAADRGLDVDTVRASLEAWGGFAARRARLEQAVTAIQAPAPLDLTDRDALIATALAAAPADAPVIPIERARRGARIARWTAAAAVLAVLVVGGVVLLRPADRGPTRATRNTEPAIESIERSGTGFSTPDQANSVPGSVAPLTAPGRPTTAATTPPSALGEISDPRTLINKVQPLVPRSPAAPSGSDPSTALAPPSGPCSATNLFPAGSVVVLDTTGTFNGAPAEVIAAQQNGSTFVYVLNPTGCSILSAVTF